MVIGGFLQTLDVNHLDEHDILSNGIQFDGYDGVYDGYLFICYKFVGSRVVRITLVTNPLLHMSKQHEDERFVYKASDILDVTRMANEAIIEFQTGQPLLGCMTIRQAILAIRKIEPNFSVDNFQPWLEVHNKYKYTKEKIYSYGSKKYISKRVVKTIIDCLTFEKTRSAK